MSPIYGIQERGLRFPRLGSIRKGEQIPVTDDQGNPRKNRAGEVIMRPVERPYFVFSCDIMTGQYIPENGMTKKEIAQAQQEHQQTEYKFQQATLEKIYSVYGTNQITELRVFLPYPDAHNAFSFWLEAYVANQKVAQSDERIITFLFDTTTGEALIKRGMVVRHSSNPNSVAGALVKQIPIGGQLPYEPDMIVGETRTKSEPITMRPVGRLNVVIPELKQAATWMVFTGSWADLSSIYSAVETIAQITKATQQPANTIPLILRRVPVESKYEDENGKTHKTTRYNIEARIVSEAIPNLLTMYENTPFMMQLPSGESEFVEESYDTPDEGLEPVEAQVEEFEDLKQQAAQAAASRATPRPELKRPFDPENLKDWFDEQVKHHANLNTPVYDKDFQIVAKALKTIFPDDTDRYTFTGWLTGNGSTKKLKVNEVAALGDWMGIDTTSKEGFNQLPSPESVQEAQVGLQFVNALNGQQEFDM